jgi:hypothetical protein
MSTRLFRIMAALCGIAGVVLLVTSFVINPGPPPNPTPAQLAAFAGQYHASVLLGAWLQAISPVLIVVFALAIVHLAGTRSRFAGLMTQTNPFHGPNSGSLDASSDSGPVDGPC